MRHFILFLGLLCIVAAGPAPGSENVHELMTEEETMQVFRSGRYAVPEYEVVPLHLPKEHKRSYDSPVALQINAFGRDIKLRLNPTDGILAGENTPVYFARSNSSTRDEKNAQPQFVQVQNRMAPIRKLLEDVEHKATMIVTQSANGQDTIIGNIGSVRWGVSPLPDRFNNYYHRKVQRSADSVDNPRNNSTENNEPHYHVVYKQPEQYPEESHGMMPVSEEFRGNQSGSSGVNVPDVIYPEVLAIADYKTYKLHGEDLDKLLTYMLLFWNGVDLKYRSLQNPKVRFNIAGIVVAQDSEALPFISNNVPKNRSDVCYIVEAILEFTDFMLDTETFSSDSYDIAIVVAPYQMCTSNNCDAGGLAWNGGACKDTRTGIIRDMGAFEGVDTAAHEIAHLFGVRHDGGTTNPQCPEDDGYIMTPNQIRTEHIAEWSSCSISQFDTFFRASNGSNPFCLFNTPRTTNPLPRVLPGRMMTRDEQCEKAHGTKACNFGVTEKNVCIKLPCFVKDSDTQCVISLSPVDGTPCGPGKICLDGKCLLQSEIL